MIDPADNKTLPLPLPLPEPAPAPSPQVPLTPIGPLDV